MSTSTRVNTVAVPIKASDSSQPKTGKVRRKASVPHRFSVDYFGFPRINDDSDESDPATSTGGVATNNNSGGSGDTFFRYAKNIFLGSGDVMEVRGNRGLQYLATFAGENLKKWS